MQLPTDLATYTQWSGIATIAFLIITIISFLLKWGLRFRLVGVTSFMGVVTASIFALNLGLFTHTMVPGSVRYALVYDNAADKVVAAVPPTVTQSEIEATLRQVEADIRSFGRVGSPENQLTIRLRTMIHPEPGVSQPLYLGQLKRSLNIRAQDDTAQVEIFEKNLAQLPSQPS